MCLEYKKVESLEKPELIEEVPQGAYLRQNVIIRVKDTVTTYCYEECFLPFAEYIKTDTYRKNRKLEDLQAHIDVIDKKRVRALCEPQLKDAATGETWLDFYTGQVLVLRDKITEILKGE